jgi:hypothetical protein
VARLYRDLIREISTCIAAAVCKVAFEEGVAGIEPRTVELGRALDFLPRNPAPPLLRTLQRYHGAYFLAESLRFSMVAVAAVTLMIRDMRGGRAVE